MEAAKAKGMRTGLVVTSSLTDATPAAFSSHVRHRGLEHSIALQHATDRTADVLLGGGRR
jgi:alkaline phosphatase